MDQHTETPWVVIGREANRPHSPVLVSANTLPDGDARDPTGKPLNGGIFIAHFLGPDAPANAAATCAAMNAKHDDSALISRLTVTLTMLANELESMLETHVYEPNDVPDDAPELKLIQLARDAVTAAEARNNTVGMLVILSKKELAHVRAGLYYNQMTQAAVMNGDPTERFTADALVERAAAITIPAAG